MLFVSLSITGRECPQNWRNKRVENRKEAPRETENKERVFSGRREDREEDQEDRYWEEEEAVLDTGCKSSLCGDF